MRIRLIFVPRKAVFSMIFTISSIIGYGQDSTLDSLSALLTINTTTDTNRVNLMIELALRENQIDRNNARRRAEDALQLSKKLGFRKGEGYAYRVLGIAAWIQGEYQKATEYGLKSLALFEGLHYKKGIASSYTLVAASYINSGNRVEGAKYLKMAIGLDQEIGNKLELSQNLNRYGNLLHHTGKYDSAFQLHTETLKLRQALNDHEGVVQTYVNIGMVLMDMKQYERAEESLQHALFRYSNSNSRGNNQKPVYDKKLMLETIYKSLSNVYTKKREFSKAESYLNQALKIEEERQSLTNLMNIYSDFEELEETRGNFKEALKYQKLYQSMRDSMYNKDKAKALAQAETEYQTIKKEQAIQLLEKEKQIQSIWQYLLAAGLFFIAIIYFMQRSRTRKTKELLQVQQVLNSKLQETDLLKSRFFANISHEFRTPLTLILSPIENRLKVKQQQLSEPDREEFELIRRNATGLLNLVNQLLDLSKLEFGKSKLQISRDDLQRFIVTLAAAFNSLAEDKEIRFEKTIDIKDPETLWYDADKIEKILNNILFNAFKFTPKGGVVRFFASANADSQFLTIQVSDTGKGIAPEHLSHIFTPFFQVQQVTDSGEAGTGLGLTLVNELIKLYQGNIDVSSTVGAGTVITITLPVALERLSHAEPVDLVTPAHFTQNKFTVSRNHEDIEDPGYHEDTTESILIIEDNPDLRNFVAAAFRTRYAIITAANGKEGLQLSVEAIPTLIICDVMMPEMDGFELSKALKDDVRTSHIPIILLTARANNESRIEGYKTGADDYITKPFSVEELQVRVENLVTQRKRMMAAFQRAVYDENIEITEESLDGKFIMQLKKTIENNLDNTAFSVEQLADDMCLSRTQLFRKVKALMATTPRELINDLRLAKATELIKLRSLSLSEISDKVGFSDQSYFSKRFRKKYGVKPSEFK